MLDCVTYKKMFTDIPNERMGILLHVISGLQSKLSNLSANGLRQVEYATSDGCIVEQLSQCPPHCCLVVNHKAKNSRFGRHKSEYMPSGSEKACSDKITQ